MKLPPEIAATVVDPTAYADDRIHQVFARLRREAPVALIEADGYDPFWLIARHADILDVERRSQEFINGDRPTLMSRGAQEIARQTGFQGPRTLIQLDGPEHLAMRQLTQGWFVPQNLRKLEARIRELARSFVARMASFGGECDFVRDVALHYPLRVIMEILGVPEADEPLMLKLTQELFGSTDKELNRAGAEVDATAAMEGTNAAVMSLVSYFMAITEDRKRNPTDDLASVIVNGRVNGEPLGIAEVMGYFVITATAGHDTTSNTTSAALWALAERPELLQALKADPSLIPAHVEESIRWATSVRHFMRTATCDTEAGGQKIAKGDWLMLNYLSGNRDEAVFENPFDYDIRRSPNRHAAFGYGPHVCLGQHLARMEMRIFWEELLPRLESVELAGEPALTSALFVGGPKHLPVRCRMH